MKLPRRILKQGIIEINKAADLRRYHGHDTEQKLASYKLIW